MRQRPQGVNTLIVLFNLGHQLGATSSAIPFLPECLPGGLSPHDYSPRTEKWFLSILAAPACNKLKGGYAEDASGIPVACWNPAKRPCSFSRTSPVTGTHCFPSSVVGQLSWDSPAPQKARPQIKPEWVSQEWSLFGPTGVTLNTFVLLSPLTPPSSSGKPSQVLTVSQNV